jgi:hypothetical protein
MQFLKHLRTGSRKVFFHTGAETEVGPFGIKKHSPERWARQMLGESRLQCRDHGGVDDVGLRTGQAQAQQLAFMLQLDFEGGGARFGVFCVFDTHLNISFMLAS